MGTADTTGEKRRRRRNPEKLTCGVCGEDAKSQHFGGIACDSCKSFFRRAVQNEVYEDFECEFTGNCVLQHVRRKQCPSCRFARCRAIGMNPKWVMSDDQRKKLRKQLLENRQAKRRQQKLVVAVPVDRPVHNPTSLEMRDLLTEDEQAAVVSLVTHFRQAVFHHAHNQVLGEINADFWHVPCRNKTGFFASNFRRSVRFAQAIPHLWNLNPLDVDTLVRSSLTHMVMLRTSFSFQADSNSWPRSDVAESSVDPVLYLENWADRLSATVMLQYKSFLAKVHRLKIDEPSVMLLMAISLFSPDRPGLTDVRSVEVLQDRFLDILRKYLQWRYGDTNASVVYPKVLELLTDVQELSEYNNEYHVWIEDHELAYISKSLGTLNPFQQYSIHIRNTEFKPYSNYPANLNHSKLVPTLNSMRRSIAATIAIECQSRRAEQHASMIPSPLNVDDEYTTDGQQQLFEQRYCSSTLSVSEDDESSLFSLLETFDAFDERNPETIGEQESLVTDLNMNILWSDDGNTILQL